MREPNVKVVEGAGHADTVLALRALAAVAGDDALGPRFLGVTGLDPAELRARAGEPALLGALIDFLASHEPDLRRIAAAIGSTPARLAAVRPA